MKRRLLILIILIFIVTIGIYIYINNMNSTSDNTEHRLSFYYQTSNGNYTKSNDEKWLTGDYALNAQNTTCDGIKSSDSVIWDNEENALLLVKDKSMRCDLYFDKKRKYTLLSGYDIAEEDVVLTNILGTDGDFESIDAWKTNPHVNESAHANYVSCELSSDIKKHGNLSCKIPGDPLFTENLVEPDKKYPMLLNHKYYVMFSVYNASNLNGSLQFYWTAWSNKGNWINLPGDQNNYNAWQKFTYVAENLEVDGASRSLRLDNNNRYQNIDLYFDELILVDLTDSYGANIPSKEELDNTLIYFDDTVDMKTIMGLEGKFKVNEASDNLDIECNNNGKATIKDGIVTITGDSPSTTCYLKKVNS